MTQALHAVLGWPVAHSKSPLIHAAFGRQFGMDLRYEALPVEAQAFADTLRVLHAQGYVGLNVTLPHKAAALAAAVSSSGRAQRAGAANTLIRTDDGWNADNTDGAGLLQDLQRLGLSPSGKRVLVLGAGGAVRGILEPLLEAGPAELVVSNRNPWKPEELAEQFKALGTIRPCTHLALKGDAFDLVIHGTSAGHGGAMPRLPAGLLARGAACYDLSYGAAFAPFRDWAVANGAAQVHDGLGMLVEQAAAAFQIWHDLAPDTAPVLEMLRQA